MDVGTMVKTGESSSPDVVELPEILRVFETSLSEIKWKLRPSSKRRFETDILALITEMRPVIMVDYGGKMPELQDRLCSFLNYCKKESPFFEHLKVMVIEDMIYLVHARAFAEFIHSSLHFDTEMVLMNIEQDPPKIVAQNDKDSVAEELVSIQKKFSAVFGSSLGKNDPPQLEGGYLTTDARSSSESSGFIDLSSWTTESGVTIPTLNGWLLGYPVVYFFSKEHIEDAIYNLSTKCLNLYQILIIRSGTSNGRGSRWEELMSFSVPYDQSVEGSSEPWAKAFLLRMQTKIERCKHVWGSLRMEVSSCYPQAIAL
ncbi:OLC1v1032602C1 [Oldenlandia corymbosa var. corymbosa]|uniref:OLC1v1032602C1 n=1 Tax=Oldenlandia corymbosa var. corymbosa TaxID=529605 RepID=A0AAV1CLD6_OLDCO|nr:OLC1v1032602C1 [Oldenlandia corymbosa var. corymbosa]